MTTAVKGYQLQLELHHDDPDVSSADRLVASRQLSNVDLVPIIECAKWDEVLRNPRLPIVLDHTHWVLEPSWDAVRGRPYIDGVQVAFGGGGHPSTQTVIPLSYFQATAKSVVAELVATGHLVAGDKCRCRVAAQACDEPSLIAGEGETDAFSVEPVVEPLAVKEADISDFLRRSTAADGWHENSMPVFMPPSVLREMQQQTREAGPVETGGVLIGHVCFDRCIPEIFLEITAQIPAVHAQQELMSLGLTPETWSGVDAAKVLRALGEVHLGWWHSHPSKAWCQDCPEEKRRTCRLGRDFFSAQDIAVHRCCFPRAFSVALVVTDSESNGLSTVMYGWRAAAVHRRGFQLLNDG